MADTQRALVSVGVRGAHVGLHLWAPHALLVRLCVCVFVFVSLESCSQLSGVMIRVCTYILHMHTAKHIRQQTNIPYAHQKLERFVSKVTVPLVRCGACVVCGLTRTCVHRLDCGIVCVCERRQDVAAVAATAESLYHLCADARVHVPYATHPQG